MMVIYSDLKHAPLANASACGTSESCPQSTIPHRRAHHYTTFEMLIALDRTSTW